MTIHSTTLTFVLSLSTAAAAQGYSMEVTSRPYSALTGGTVWWDATMAPADDEFVQVTLPFAVSFFGRAQTTAYISVNGFLSFLPPDSQSWRNEPIPDPATTSGMIAPFWDDLIVASLSSASQVRSAHVVTPTTECFVVEWRNMHRFDDTVGDLNTTSFQLRIDRGTNTIELCYDVFFSMGTPPSVWEGAVGIQEPQGGRGYSHFPTRDDLAGFGPDTLLRFTPSPTNYTLSRRAEPYVPLGPGRQVIRSGSSMVSDDEWLTLVTGFPFDYYGTTGLLLARISTNGLVSFAPQAGSAAANTLIPGSAAYGPALAPWWDDLRVDAVGLPAEISTERLGSPGSYVTVYEWRNIGRATDTGFGYHEVSFQVRLHEGSNRIELHYGDSLGTGASTGFTASMGIQDEGGGEGIGPIGLFTNLGLGSFPPSGTVLSFAPPSSLVCGDCNDDGQVAIVDALLAAQHASGLIALVDPAFAACNVSGTLGGAATAGATVDILDSLGIARSVSGLPVSLGCAP